MHFFHEMATLLDTQLDVTSTSRFKASLGLVNTESSITTQIAVPLTEFSVRPGSQISFYLPANLGYVKDPKLEFTMNLTFKWVPAAYRLIVGAMAQAAWQNLSALEASTFPKFPGGAPAAFPRMLFDSDTYALDFQKHLGAWSLVSSCSIETTTGVVFDEINSIIQLEKWMQWQCANKSPTDLQIFDQLTQAGICQPNTLQPNMQPAFNCSGKTRCVSYEIDPDRQEITFVKKVTVPIPLTFGDKWPLKYIGDCVLRMQMAEISYQNMTCDRIICNAYLDLRSDYSFSETGQDISGNVPPIPPGLPNDPSNSVVAQSTFKSILAVGVCGCQNNPAVDKYQGDPMSTDWDVTFMHVTFNGIKLTTGDLEKIIGSCDLNRSEPQIFQWLQPPQQGRTYNPGAAIFSSGAMMYIRVAHFDLPVSGASAPYAFPNAYAQVLIQGVPELNDAWTQVPVYASNIANVFLVGSNSGAYNGEPEDSQANCTMNLSELGKESSVYVQFVQPIVAYIPVKGVNLTPIVTAAGGPGPARISNYGGFLPDPTVQPADVPYAVDIRGDVLPLMMEQNIGFEVQFIIGEQKTNIAYEGHDGGNPVPTVNQNVYESTPDINQNYVHELLPGAVSAPELLMPKSVSYSEMRLTFSKQKESEGVAKYLNELWETDGIVISQVGTSSACYNISSIEGLQLTFSSESSVLYGMTFEVRPTYQNVPYLQIAMPCATMQYYTLSQGSYIVRKVLQEEQAEVIGSKYVCQQLCFSTQPNGPLKAVIYGKPTGTGPSEYLYRKWAQFFGNATGESEKSINMAWLHSAGCLKDGIYNANTRDGGALLPSRTTWDLKFQLRNRYPQNSRAPSDYVDGFDRTPFNTPDIPFYYTLDNDRANIWLQADATSTIPTLSFYITSWQQRQWVIKKGRPLQGTTALGVVRILE
jgi:hypothetical protein